MTKYAVPLLTRLSWLKDLVWFFSQELLYVVTMSAQGVLSLVSMRRSHFTSVLGHRARSLFQSSSQAEHRILRLPRGLSSFNAPLLPACFSQEQKGSCSRTGREEGRTPGRNLLQLHTASWSDTELSCSATASSRNRCSLGSTSSTTETALRLP